MGWPEKVRLGEILVQQKLLTEEQLKSALALAEELRVALPKDADQHQLLKSLTRALLDFARQGKTVVLCLDEAQAMPIETLESLRLLTNLEIEKRKLLQVVLFGQPELDRKLEGESVRQLRQRITFQYKLTPLSRDELDHYLAHRLRVAGYRGNRLFTKPAARVVHRLSGGVPRLINIVAHKALLLTYGEGMQQVLPRHAREAAVDTPRDLAAAAVVVARHRHAAAVGGRGRLGAPHGVRIAGVAGKGAHCAAQHRGRH